MGLKTFRSVMTRVPLRLLFLVLAGFVVLTGIGGAAFYERAENQILTFAQGASLLVKTYVEQRQLDVTLLGLAFDRMDPTLTQSEDAALLSQWALGGVTFRQVFLLDRQKNVKFKWVKSEKISFLPDILPAMIEQAGPAGSTGVYMLSPDAQTLGLAKGFRFGWVVAYLDLSDLERELSRWSLSLNAVLRFVDPKGEGSGHAPTTSDAMSIVATVPIEGFPWNLEVSEPWTRLFPPFFPYGALFFIFLLSTVLVVLWVRRYLMSRVLHVLDDFQRETIKIASGDYSVAIGYTGYEDLNLVLKEFENMREKIWLREQDLRDSEYRFRRMFEDAQIGIMHSTLDGYLLDMNQTMAQILGFSKPSEAMSFFQSVVGFYVRPEERQTFVHLLQSNSEGKVRTHTEFYTRNQTKTVAINLYLSRVFDPRRSEFILEAFCEDITELQQAEKAIRNINQDLEQKVQERTRHLEMALTDLKAAQEQLVQAEKLAALGQLIAGIAHEVNTPLGAIAASNDNILSLLKKVLESLPWLMQVLTLEQRALFYQLYEIGNREIILVSSFDLRQKRKTLTRFLEEHGIEADRELVDNLTELGVESELETFLPLLKDPLGRDAVRMINEMLSMEKSCAIIDEASDKAAKVIQALRTFSHQEETEVFRTLRLEEGLETVLTLFQNKIKLGVDVVRRYDPIDSVCGYADRLNQVWTNLISNALQAMEYKGKLEITVRLDGEWARVDIADSGPGIPQAIQHRIFEPFYTTKKPGEGSGLGLDISRKIVLEHKGKILFESVPGKTVFSVYLPLSIGEA